MRKLILPVLLLGVVTLAPLKVMAKPEPILNSAIHKIANSSNDQSTKNSNKSETNKIPLKNAKLGKITNLSFSTQPNPNLRQAFSQIEGFNEALSWIRESTNGHDYGYAKFDLNNDGIQDAIVTFRSSFANGSGGQHYWIFRGTKDGYYLIGNISNVWDILISPTKNNGWHNLIRIPGKLFMWKEAYYESYRFNGKEYNLYGNLKQGVTLSGYRVPFPFDDPKFWHPL